MEERADGDVHRGPAAVTSSPQVPQQIPLGRRGALEAAPLPQEQQWPLTPGTGSVPRDSTSSEKSAWATRPTKWSLWEKCEDERWSRSPPGCSVAGGTQDSEMLLLGVATTLRLGGASSPPEGLPPRSHPSTLKTTEETKFSFFATHFFWL